MNKTATETQASPVIKTKKASKFTQLRRCHNARLIVILLLMIIVACLYFFWGKFRVALVGLFIALLVALGLEASGNDWDLGKLLKTGSFEQSKVGQTKDGNWLLDNCGADDLNCANFTYQEDAQAIYEECAAGGQDVYRLDGDKDGVVCEMLPLKAKAN